MTFFWQNQYASNPQSDYVTKQGKHGTLYLHAIEYDDPSDPGFSPDIWRTYAYDFEHARAGEPIWYQAPFDRYPVRVMAKVRGPRSRTVRVTPPSRDADPFTADSGHLSRFRKRVS